MGDYDDRMMEAAVSLLDSKGITSLRDNLSDTTVKRIEMVKEQSIVLTAGDMGVVDPSRPRTTPFERSKTKLGKQLMEFLGD